MGRTLDEVINKLPPDRQARIASLAEKKMDEMIVHATTLTDFRKAVGKTRWKLHLLDPRGRVAGKGVTKRDAIDDALGIMRATQLDGGQGEREPS